MQKNPCILGFLETSHLVDTTLYLTLKRMVNQSKVTKSIHSNGVVPSGGLATRKLGIVQENPKAFAPQYGGYCAWAISQGKLAKGDPKVYALVNGKLYLNYSKKIEKRWHINRDNFIRLAEVEYPQLVDLSESSNN